MALALLILFVVAVAPYIRSWGFNFVYLDDTEFVVDGAWFFRDWDNLPNIFLDDVWSFFDNESSLYRPLLLLPRFFEMSVFQVSPGPYHIFNTALHFGAVALLFLLLRTLMGEVKWPLVWAALFAVHPAHVPVVAWIEGYNNSMLALFVLAALLSALRALQTGRTLWAISSGLAFFLALLTKENAICTPLLCVGLCALHLRRSGARLERGPMLEWMVGTWCLALLTWFFLRSHAVPATPELEPDHVFESIARNHLGLLLYWGKIFFPFNLAPLPILRDSSIVPGAVAVALYVALLVRSSREDRAVLGYGLGWFLLMISPSLLIARLGSPTGAIFREDRLYQASLGPLIALALVSRTWVERHSRTALYVAGACAVVSVCLGQFFIDRYSDGFSFYSAAVATSPHLAPAHTHLADRYVQREDFVSARQEYEKALSLNPRYRMLNNNYGLLLIHDGEYESAEQHFQAEIAVNPLFAKVHYNRGMLFGRRGNFAAAAESFERVLALRPHDAELVFMTRLGLVEFYTQLNQPERAQAIASELAASGATPISLADTDGDR